MSKNIEICKAEEVGAQVLDELAKDISSVQERAKQYGISIASPDPSTAKITELRAVLSVFATKVMDVFNSFIAGLQSTIASLNASIAAYVAQIADMNSDIADAYDAVEDKGGTLPEEQTSVNLPTAIESIPSGGSPYDELLQIGFSQSDIDTLSEFCTPSAEDIAESALCVGLSGTGERAWWSHRNLRYYPPYTITDGKLEEYVYACYRAEIIGELKSATPFTIASSPFRSAPAVRYLAGEVLDLSGCSTIKELFYSCKCLQRIPKIKTSSLCTNCEQLFRESLALVSADVSLIDWTNITSVWNMFYGCSALTEVKGVIDLANTTNIVNICRNCTSLKEIRIKNIGYDLNITGSNNLSYDSLLYMVQNLQNVSGKVLTIGATNKAKLNATADGQAAIATAQGYGWTIS